MTLRTTHSRGPSYPTEGYLPALTLALFSALPMASCSREASASPSPREETSRNASGLIARVAGLIPGGLAIGEVVAGVTHMEYVRLQLTVLGSGNMESVPGLVRGSVRSVVTAILAQDENKRDLLHELSDILQPFDTDGNGVVSQADLQSSTTPKLTPRWTEFVAEYGTTLGRYLTLAELAGWELRQ